MLYGIFFWIKPYFYLGRFHSLTGFWLLLLPSFWSIAFNAYNLSFICQLYYYLIFTIGALFMRAFGCVINDLADKKFDSQVERTKNRPLANSTLTTKNAILFMFFLIIPPTIIFLTFNVFAQIITIISLFLVFFYPFTKRFFYAPQLILGVTFNCGILLADAILHSSISFSTIVLYAASILWTIAYDTIYAYQDYQEDKRIGIRSTAVLIGDKPIKIIFIIYMLIALLIFYFLFFNKFNVASYFLVCISFIYITYYLIKLDYTNPSLCFKFFNKNVIFAIIIWLSISLNYFL